MKLSLYRIETVRRGDLNVLVPKVPDNTMHYEDKETPRVCACPTIYGCLLATELAYLVKDPLDMYLYKAEIDTDITRVRQPTYDEVPDAWVTGEFWILDPVVFKLQGRYIITPQMKVADGYERFACTIDEPEVDEVVNRQRDKIVYGDPDAFSLLSDAPYYEFEEDPCET